MQSSSRNSRSELSKPWVNFLEELINRSSAGTKKQKPRLDLYRFAAAEDFAHTCLSAQPGSNYFLNKNSKLEENYLTCVINEWLNKNRTKQWHGMETTLSNGRVISKVDYLWLIDSACKSGRWLCCDSRGREGRGRERSRWREYFWVCRLLKKRKIDQLGTHSLITTTASDKSIYYPVNLKHTQQ